MGVLFVRGEVSVKCMEKPVPYLSSLKYETLDMEDSYVSVSDINVESMNKVFHL
jgi:hypothetical protein